MKGRKGNNPGPTAPAAKAPPKTASPPTEAASPTSPTSKSTAKYTNKDGSKFITVPKAAAGVPAPMAPPTPSSSTTQAPGPETSALNANAPPAAEEPQPTVNRKKAKRRAKAAAKALAEQDLDDQRFDQATQEHLRETKDSLLESIRRNGGEGEFMDIRDPRLWEDTGFDPDAEKSLTKSKKKKKKKGGANSSSADRPADGEIWDMDSHQERERIKEFWMSLSEADRKDLVKVEKDAVLKKMKEQQKHQCSCTVCGRKRTAIEEELEGLYDAYYEELEQYAHDPLHQPSVPPMLGSPHHNYHTGHGRGAPTSYAPQQPSRGRIVEQLGDDDQDDGDYDSDDDEHDELDDDDEYSGDEEDLPPDAEAPRDDYFFSFGNSLTVKGRNIDPSDSTALARASAYAKLLSICKQFEDTLSTIPLPSPDVIKRLITDVDKSLGGILTVADDLLKNDGKKFIEMMERLAERRMNREENLRDQYAHGTDYHAVTNGHTHPHPPSEEDDYPDDEEDEDYSSQEEDFEDDEDTMTDEQRMEEGRRMFQIFAARMFEQRVLNAYRKKRSKERQDALVKQIESEELLEAQRKEAKAKAAQKKKEKAAQKKQALAEEKARKEAEKLAEAEKRRAEEAERAEEQRLAAEEKRKKKEAQKKAEEDERIRKEAERVKRLQEQKERQAEQERKAREAKEREKKTREEAKLKEKQARERKEKESRERREKQEQDKRDKEARAKANEAKAKQKRDEKAAQKAAAVAPVVVPITLAKRPSQQANTAVPAVPQQQAPTFGSPQIPIATPALPKAPTPMRPRQVSQQGHSSAASRSASQQSGSVTSRLPSPTGATPSHVSPGPIGAPRTASLGHAGPSHAHATSPLASSIRPAMQQPSPYMMPPMGMPGFPNSMSPGGGLPGAFNPGPTYPPIGGGTYRPPGPPAMMPMPPGINGPGRGFPGVAPPPGLPQPSPEQLAAMAQFNNSLPHDGSPAEIPRQPSGGFDLSSSIPATQPIARPAPIGRPSSVVHGQRPAAASPAPDASSDQDDGRLGSKALLDDADFDPENYTMRPTPTTRPAFPPPGLGGFGMGDPFVGSQSRIWNNPVMPPFGHNHGPPPGGFPLPNSMSSGTWGPPSGPSLFPQTGSISRPAVPRQIKIRRILCGVCKDMTNKAVAANPDSDEARAQFFPVKAVKEQTELLLGTPVQESELDQLYDTEGNGNNGGGMFEIRKDKDGSVTSIRWTPSVGGIETLFRAMGGMGDVGGIGSPVIGSVENDGWGGPHRN